MTPRRIGIPRALHFYEFHPLWGTFFRSLGHEVVFSPETTRSILAAGVKGCVHDVCLPVKTAYGHVAHLRAEVDYLFLPRLMSMRKGTYVCPKIVAFPDLVLNLMEDLPEILDPEIDLRRGKTHEKALRDAGRRLGASRGALRSAYRAATAAQMLRLLRTRKA